MCSTLSNDPEERPQMAFALLYEEAVVGILKNILIFLGMQLLNVQLFCIRFIFAFLNAKTAFLTNPNQTGHNSSLMR